MPDADRCFLEIAFSRRRDIDKGLRVPVYEREPAALHLYHDAVAFLKGVRDLVELKSNLCRLARHQGFGFFKAVAELAPEHLRPDEALIRARGRSSDARS